MRDTLKRRGLVAVGSMAAASMVAVAVTGGVSSATSGTHQVKAHASSSLPGLYGNIPAPSGKPVNGGTVSIAENPGAGPNYIFPIVPSALSSVFTIYQFQYLMWRPLYWAPVGATPTIDPGLSLASAPTFSNGDKTVTIHMKTNWTWSDGAPVDAADVEFYVDILKAAVKESAANSGNYSPGYFPDNVASMSVPSKYTLVMHLTKSYNPQWFYLDELGLIVPLPSTAWSKASPSGSTLAFTNPANAKKIYDFLNAQSKNLATFDTNPLWQVVDGPYHLTSYTSSNNAATLSANNTYTLGKPHITTVQLVPFTSTAAEFNQLRSGTLDVGQLDFTDLPQVPQLRRQGYNVFGYPDFGFNYMAFNFLDKTGDWNHIVAQLYVRQALAHLIDEPGYIQGIFKGAAVPSYGVAPKYPTSPYTPADNLNPLYPYSTSSAKSLLTSHGWKIVGGTMTCEKAGSGATACGAGIPVGTKLAFNIDCATIFTFVCQQVDSFVSDAAVIGVKIAATQKTFNFILSNDNDVSAPSNDNKWAMTDFGGFTNSVYPTTNTLFNTGGSYNFGAFNDPTMNSLINASVYGGNPTAVKNELSYASKALPGLFQPAFDLVWAYKNTIQGPVNSFASLSQYFLQPEMWWVK